MANIPCIITCAKFGDDRLKGLGAAWIRFAFFSLTLIVVLTTLSHYRASV